MSAIIEARGLTLRFGKRTVLADVDFSVATGEIVGLIGPNGAGKTTLLRTLAGLLVPDAGEVRIDDRDAAALDRRARARLVAYLEQAGESHWPVNVGVLIAMGRLPHTGPWAGPSAHDRAAIERAMNSCDARPLADRAMDQLSGGERARVLLARALAVEGRALLADEPVAGLDPAHQIDVMEVLRARAAEGTGVVVVAHDLTLAARCCDRLVLMDGGRVAAEGPPETVLTDENLARCYGISAHRGIDEAGRMYVVPTARAGEEGAAARTDDRIPSGGPHDGRA